MTFTSILQLHKNGKEKRFGGFFPFSTLFIYLFVCLFVCLFIWGVFGGVGYFGFPWGKEYLHHTKCAPLCENTNLVWKGLGFTYQEKMP